LGQSAPAFRLIERRGKGANPQDLDSGTMYVTVVGGGNSTPIFAALAKDAGHTVAILTRRPDDWDPNDVGFVNDDAGYMGGAKELRVKVDLITADPAACIPQADLIFLAGLPIHHNPEVLGRIRPHMDMTKRVFVGSICAYGGFNWVASDALGPGEYSLFGTQLIPWCCGTKEYGRTGAVFGAKRLLRIATEGGKDAHGVKPILGKILKMDFLTDTDFIASSLWPNNPSLHPPILYGLFKDWDGASPCDPAGLPTLIYADMRTESAKAVVGLDAELSAIAKKLSELYPHNAHLKSDFSMWHCVNENYKEQISCKWDAVSSILTNKAFSQHKIPYTQVAGGVVPTLKHKFFETDLPFGLCTFVDIARMIDVPTPVIDAIIRWNQKLIGKEYMTASGRIDGAHAGECVLPTAFGLTKTTLEYGNRQNEPAAKKQKQ
jgi:opine dehydrogenase